jgi:hypothetical protein
MTAKKTLKPKKKPLAVKPIPPADIQDLLSQVDDEPSVFWENVEGTWDWIDLRKGGKLAERVKQLDRQFVQRSKTHRVCPIVILLNAGEIE